MSENLSTMLESTEPTLLTTGWGRTEGPLWHAEGYVTFVNLRRQSAPPLGPEWPGHRGARADGGGERLHPRSLGASAHV